MKNKLNNSVSASALQITLLLAFLIAVAIAFATNLKAVSSGGASQIQQASVVQDGFYPPLPAPAISSQSELARPAGEPTCTPKEVDDKIAPGDPKQNAQINPTGTASSCGTLPSCSTTSGMFHYKAHSFINDTGTNRCVTATLSTSCTGANAIFAAAYLGSFDPGSICTNLIGDLGSPSTGSPASFSFNVPAGATFIVVVSETTPNAFCSGYKLEIFGLCASPTPTPGVCPLTQGYWKNHPSAWPVTTLTLGSQSYTQAELLTILRTSPRGDASLILAHQLIAAKLSVAHGSDPTPISATIAHADVLLSGFSGKLPYNVPASSSTGQAMVADSMVLDHYNNGALTPGCLDN